MMWRAAVLAVALALCTAQAPPPAAAGALDAFVGMWNGTWNDIMPTTLVVESITPPTARVIYEWGAAPQWQIDNPGFIRATARFVEGRLVLPLPSGATAIYAMQRDGTLAATVTGNDPAAGGSLHAILTKQ